MKKIITIVRSTLVLLVVCTLLGVPLSSYAATIHAEVAGKTVGEGKSLIVRLWLKTDEAAINSVSGSLRIPAGVHVDSVDTAGSVFTLWITTPQFVISDGAINFSGGVPHGVSSNKDVLLFTVTAHADNPGSYTFTPENITSYRNDGLGTTEKTATVSGEVTVDTSAQAQNVPQITTSNPLVADVGRDDALFDGKYFVAFYGGDSGSGIDHYEVKEGWGGTPAVVDRFYVIKDQSLRTKIQIRAIGTDGKKVAVNVTGLHTTIKPLILSVSLIVLLLVLVLVALRKKIWATITHR